MGNGPQARLPGRLCSFSDMGRMPHSERAPPSSGTAAPRFFPILCQQKPLRQAGKARKAAAGRPTARPPQPQPGGHRPRYASTTISSFVSRAV